MLLVMALLGLGTSAWAAVGDKSTNLDIDFSNAISDGKVAGTTGSMTIGGSNTEIADGKLSVGNGTSTAALTGSAAGSGDQVVVTFDLAFGKLINKSVWFRLKDSSSNIIGEFDFYPYGGTINTNTFNIATDDIYYANNTVIWDRKVSFTITLNYKTRKITTATTCLKSGTGKPATNAEHTVDMTNSNPLATFEIGSGYDNDGRRCSFDNLKVETIEGEAATSTSYTVNYQLSGKTVKTVSSNDAVVGQVVTADVAIDGTEEGYVGNHYLITAAEAPTMTLVAEAASNVLNVPVRAPYTATLNVTTTIGGIVGSPVITNLTETDAKVCSWSYAWSLYVEKDSKFYLVDNAGSYGESGTFTDGDVINKTVTYTNEATDVVYFEDALGKTARTGASGGYTGVWGGDNTKIGSFTLDKGVYEVTFYVWAKAGNGSNHRGEQLDVKGTEVVSVTGNTNGARVYNFTVEADASTIDIYGKGSNKATDEIDYVLIKKLPATVSKTITSAGWATYCSPYALDLANATGLTDAYIVTGGANGVLAKTSVKGGTVPANTGLLLKGSEGTVTIPVVASSETNVSANKLIGKTAEYNLAADDGYVLMNDANHGLAFYKNENDFTVGANTAYLPANFTVSGARSFFSLFNAETTGIEDAVKSKEIKDKIFYNLSGQRVKKATKGLYIVNGKKYVK